MSGGHVVPVDACVKELLTKEERKGKYVVITDATIVKPSFIRKEIFGNLTLGSFLQVDGSFSAPVRLNYDNDLKAKIIAACAQLHVGKHARPSAAQAIQLFHEIGVPVAYGEVIYRDLGTRVLNFIDRQVSPGALANAMSFDTAGRARWKTHTAHWTAESTTYEEICDRQSDGLRVFQPPQTQSGVKRIVDGAVGLMAVAEVWDTQGTRLNVKIKKEPELEGAELSSLSSASSESGSSVEQAPVKKGKEEKKGKKGKKTVSNKRSKNRSSKGVSEEPSGPEQSKSKSSPADVSNGDTFDNGGLHQVVDETDPTSLGEESEGIIRMKTDKPKQVGAKDSRSKAGATKNGASNDSATKNGATKDGATKDGATKDVAPKDARAKHSQKMEMQALIEKEQDSSLFHVESTRTDEALTRMIQSLVEQVSRLTNDMNEMKAKVSE